MELDIYQMSEHARLDASPLRYGVIPPKWVQLRNLEHREIGTNNQKPREITAGNRHYVADCHDKETEEFLFNGCFVIAPARRSDYFDTIVTVLSVGGDRSERGLSDTLRDYREQGKLTPEYIRDKLHPEFKAGNCSSASLLLDVISDHKISEALKDKDEYIQRLENKSDAKDIELRKKQQLIDQQEIEILENEKKKSDFNSTDRVELSPIMILKEVVSGERKNASGRVVKCTKLYFEEPGAPVRIMDEWADKDGLISSKAKSLIGKPVRTSSWRPDKFKPLHWWRDIYLV